MFFSQIHVAIQASLTGHLVLSTLHTNDSSGAVSRLLDMGVESFLISSALVGVLSQRLVRKICPKCKGEGIISKSKNPLDSSEFKKCRACSGRGYKGRIGIFEFLQMNDELRKAVNERKDSTVIAAISKKYGMKSLKEAGMLKVKEGLTTEAEISRVCQLDTM